MTWPGTWPVSRHRSIRGAVHSRGLTLRALPIFLPMLAAGLTASTCGTRSASDEDATAMTRLIRASVSGRVEYRLPSLAARTASRRRIRSERSVSASGRLILRIAAARSRK